MTKGERRGMERAVKELKDLASSMPAFLRSSYMAGAAYLQSILDRERGTSDKET